MAGNRGRSGLNGPWALDAAGDALTEAERSVGAFTCAPSREQTADGRPPLADGRLIRSRGGVAARHPTTVLRTWNRS